MFQVTKSLKSVSRRLSAGVMLAVVAAFGGQTATAQGVEGPYACQKLEFFAPDPSDPVGPLTQGSNGFFFRTDPDLNWGFFMSDEAQQHLKTLNDGLARRGTTLVLLPVPPRGLVAQNYIDLNADRSPVLSVAEGSWMFDTMVRDLRDTGAVVPNIMNALREQPREAPQFYFRRDTAWQPNGARFAADVIARTLRDEGVLRGAVARGFQTSVIGEASLKGELAQAAQRHCDVNLPAEPYTEYTTRSTSTFGPATGGTRVVVVGDSLAADPRWNFDGFLTQSLGMEVENHAVDSDREFNAVEAYLASSDFRNNPPQILIWQLPATFDLSRRSLELRQLNDAVLGDCGNFAVARTSTNSSGFGTIVQLPLSGAQGIMPENHYLHLRMSNPAMNNFVVSVNYQDGDAEWIPVERQGRFDNPGEYFVSLSRDINSPITSIEIEQLSEASSAIEIDVCRK